jgi:hypothetical protein
MSTPEVTPKEFLIKSNIYAHDLIDEMEDMKWRDQGKKTAKNDSESLCGGDKPISECVTSTEMAKQIISQLISVNDTESVDDTSPRLFNSVKTVLADSSCGDCEMICHAYGKTIDGEPSEKIRFMYEGQVTPSSR